MNKVELVRDADNLTQIVYAHLSNAVKVARTGKFPGEDWEKAQRAQGELLKALAKVQQAHAKPPGA